MVRKLVLLNGPAGCGKDTAGRIIAQHYNVKHVLDHGEDLLGHRSCITISPADYLKDLTHEMFGLACDTHHYEAIKNDPHPDFMTAGGMLSARRAYIHVREQIMKPLFGNHVFSKRLVQKINTTYEYVPLIVNTSLGFTDEAHFLMQAYGADNCMLIRMKRPGHTFDGDSRMYIYNDDIQTHEVYNDKTPGYLQDLSDKILPLVRAFYNS